MTPESPGFRLQPKQTRALETITNHRFTLLDGSSRSGKTVLAVWLILFRMVKYPGSVHLAARLRFNHAKQHLFLKTVPDVARMAFPGVEFNFNKSDFYIETPQGSRLWIGGLDDKERTEKILGAEYSTIFLNEASQLSFRNYEMVTTRLNPSHGMKPVLVVDYNPPSTAHWGYQLFHLKKDPISGNPIPRPELYGQVHFHVRDNIENLSAGYIESLETLSEAQRRRFLDGLYSDATEGALWSREWIQNNRVTAEAVPELQRLIIAVDPSVTTGENADDTGIVAVGSGIINGERHFYVIDDLTESGGVVAWGQAVVDAYRKYSADGVVAEANQGGDLVAVNIRNYDRNAPVKLVRASRGKQVRAAPVADLYRRGLVHHVGTFAELEDQMVSWTPESGYSPDNLDALVWGVTHLAGLQGSGTRLNWVF